MAVLGDSQWMMSKLQAGYRDSPLCGMWQVECSVDRYAENGLAWLNLWYRGFLYHR